MSRKEYQVAIKEAELAIAQLEATHLENEYWNLSALARDRSETPVGVERAYKDWKVAQEKIKIAQAELELAQLPGEGS